MALVVEWNTLFSKLFLFLVFFISIKYCLFVSTSKKINWKEEGVKFSFLCYSFFLVEFVTKKNKFSWTRNNYHLLKEILRYPLGSKLFFQNVIGNVLLFLPYGFFLSYFGHPKSVWKTLLLGFLSSLAIEMVQIKIGRVFDIDDLLLNTIGTLFGYKIYQKGKNRRGG